MFRANTSPEYFWTLFRKLTKKDRINTNNLDLCILNYCSALADLPDILAENDEEDSYLPLLVHQGKLRVQEHYWATRSLEVTDNSFRIASEELRRHNEALEQATAVCQFKACAASLRSRMESVRKTIREPTLMRNSPRMQLLMQLERELRTSSSILNFLLLKLLLLLPMRATKNLWRNATAVSNNNEIRRSGRSVKAKK